MAFKMNKAAAVCLVLCSTAFSGAMADGSVKDVVVNKDGVPVVNTFNNCVRTKWDANSDKCGSGSGAVVPATPSNSQYVAPQAQSQLVDKSRSYLVFFDFDKSVLTSDAQEILATLRKDANNRNKGATKFEITGHADRSGSDNYNQRLSEKRAAAVKKQLIGLGVPAENISTQAKGESVPLVPTDDGVREPQNRRAEVVFGYRE